MKIAVVGIDFPLGKKSLPDERLDHLRDIFHSPKVTYIQIDFVDEARVGESEGIICEKNAKLDLILKDLEIMEAQVSAGNTHNRELFLRAKEALEKEIVLNEVPFTEEEKKILFNLNLVTLKPISFVDKENLAPIPQIMQQAYAACGMVSFFTVNERELRAWAIKKGTTVHLAAGSIHSDLQRGFIKAEIVAYADLIKSGGLNQAKALGLLKLENKEYILRDGDLIQIRFNV